MGSTLTLRNAYLWYGISQNDISSDANRVKVVIDLPQPISPKGIQVFMGHCNYYHIFIYIYTKVSWPFYAILVVFEWIDDYNQAFDKLENTLILAPILKAPD